MPLTTPVYLERIADVDMIFDESLFTHFGRLSSVLVLNGAEYTFKGPNCWRDSKAMLKPVWCQIPDEGM